MRGKIFLMIIFFEVLISCSPIKQAQKTAVQKYGQDTLSFLNETKNKILYLKTEKQLKAPSKAYFFVYDLDKKEIIYEDSIPSAFVKWNDCKSLIINEQRGFVRNPEDDGKTRYIYDLETKKKNKLPRKNGTKL